MKKKDLIFYAGAAILMAASTQGVSADELVSKETAITEGKQVQTEKAPEVAVSEKTAAPIVSNYVAPANVTEQSVASTSTTTVSESSTPSVEKSTEVAPTEKTEETPLQSDAGSTTFFNTGSNAPASRSTDVAVQKTLGTRTRMRRTKFAMHKLRVCKYRPTTSLAILLKKRRVQKHDSILRQHNV